MVDVCEHDAEEEAGDAEVGGVLVGVEVEGFVPVELEPHHVAGDDQEQRAYGNGGDGFCVAPAGRDGNENQGQGEVEMLFDGEGPGDADARAEVILEVEQVGEDVPECAAEGTALGEIQLEEYECDQDEIGGPDL